MREKTNTRETNLSDETRGTVRARLIVKYLSAAMTQIDSARGGSKVRARKKLVSSRHAADAAEFEAAAVVQVESGIYSHPTNA